MKGRLLRLRNALRRQELGRADIIAAGAIPVVVTAVLAAVLFSQLARSGPAVAPGVWSPPVDTTPIGAGASLPVSDVAMILEDVQARTGHRYACTGPYSGAGRILNWACRTPDAVVVLEALADRRVYRVEATWFGFDTAATDLPAWAAATQRVPALADAAATWVAEHVHVSTSATAADLHLETGGARGAHTLVVAQP